MIDSGPPGVARDRLKVLGREENDQADDGRSEIVAVRVDDGPVRRLLCKYETEGGSASSNLAYEAEVYRQVLEPLDAPAPAFYGLFEESAPDRRWLAIEYLPDAVPLDAGWTDEEIVRTAASAGRFHRRAEELVATRAPEFLVRYSPVYWEEHARRAADAGGENAAWLEEVAGGIDGSLARLLTARPTVVHGDIYLNNVLVDGESVYLIDWEMAGIGPGELDLAELLYSVGGEYEEVCTLAYSQARWPQGAPDDFQQVLDAARICLSFYNLNRPGEDYWFHLGELRHAGERLGLIA
jgi:aminoglycoside phosphotransferase